MRVTELREYKIKPGKTEQWLKWMKDEILPLQRSKGMKIVATHVHKGEDGEDYFVWLREFENEEARQKITQETYDEYWVSTIRPKVFELIEQDSVKVRLIHPVDL
ncbi:NIPSNAP family protein [Vibrio marisflavi]|uniref:NIPSNAP domain-containing protein n=1 Tax=Vibrio marisflavi CECT 7928 TaxID=634439 RepID=A0ABN8E8U1_9VIBR|nr:NIPSNAP family protein [Vibrio marisflavi]CAH0541693.1 hypothetical protein VMF7928_03759 [Vibrio marisflavi CECT 7928]